LAASIESRCLAEGRRIAARIRRRLETSPHHCADPCYQSARRLPHSLPYWRTKSQIRPIFDSAAANRRVRTSNILGPWRVLLFEIQKVLENNHARDQLLLLLAYCGPTTPIITRGGWRWPDRGARRGSRAANRQPVQRLPGSRSTRPAPTRIPSGEDHLGRRYLQKSALIMATSR